ncbi:MAG TPA: hypothetical protein VGR02_00070 [Thermoanaerobaculia bacterium]|jgi:hypothetical protein|nr:hypothetical protein [Thermoanaerobaculia bacterium]
MARYATRIILFLTAFALSATPAQDRMQAARELQSTFDGSLIKGFELNFVVRGPRCDVLHIEGYTNLYEGQMQALANGTLIYGQIQPGGVNSFAFRHGFRNVIYTNTDNPTSASFGEPTVTRSQVRRMRRCTEAIAAKLSSAERPVAVPAPPAFEPLTSATATMGRKLYDGGYRHDATIVRVDRAEDLIYVKYVSSGSVEPKRLRAVAPYWYVRK